MFDKTKQFFVNLKRPYRYLVFILSYFLLNLILLILAIYIKSLSSSLYEIVFIFYFFALLLIVAAVLGWGYVLMSLSKEIKDMTFFALTIILAVIFFIIWPMILYYLSVYGWDVLSG